MGRRPSSGRPVRGAAGRPERLDRLGCGAKSPDEEREVAAPQLWHDRAGAIDHRRQHQLQDPEVLGSREDRTQRPKLDLLGTLAASAGLFALVLGFSTAETTVWTPPLTIAALVGGASLLVLFVRMEARVEHPLLPLRVLADRGCGASCLAIALAMVSMFGAFLFLTFYFQEQLAYTPTRAGMAFLPMTLAVMATAATAETTLLPRFGPRALVALGMGSGAIAMLLLTKLDVHSSYATAVGLPLVLLGIGVGLVIATAINTGTLGVEARDAGIASAMINTSQQIGCAVGTALLSTIASGATSAHQPAGALVADATVHGYAAAFWCSAGVAASARS